MDLRKIEVEILEYAFEELDEATRQLIEKAKAATRKSYVPYSHYSVGAAVLLADGQIVAGNNQENIAYPSGLCAERTAMFYANATHPDVAPVALAIAASFGGEFVDEPITPCGSCRQVLAETEMRFKQDIRVLLYGKNRIYSVPSIKMLLPLAFNDKRLKK